MMISFCFHAEAIIHDFANFTNTDSISGLFLSAPISRE